MSDFDDLERVLNSQPGAKELEEALERQEYQNQKDLERMFGVKLPVVNFEFGTIDHPTTSEMVRCNKLLSSIGGVQLKTNGSVLMVYLEVPLYETSKEAVILACKTNSWQFNGWYSIVNK